MAQRSFGSSKRNRQYEKIKRSVKSRGGSTRAAKAHRRRDHQPHAPGAGRSERSPQEWEGPLPLAVERK
jgi:hypothetical protein